MKSGKEPVLDGPIDSGPEIELHFTALIPDDYLPDVHTRLVLYKRIASAETPEQLRDLKVEMIDRFGLLPEPTKNLFEVAEIKMKAAEIGILKIETSAAGGRIVFCPTPNIDPASIIELVQNPSGRYKMEGPEKLGFSETLINSEEKIEFVHKLLDTLTEKPRETA